MSDFPDFVPMDSVPGAGGVVTRADVVVCARSWLGTKYQHQHRIKGHGVDCAGLVIGVARELGLVAPDFDVNAYARSPDGESLLIECERFMRPVPLWNMKPGHVLALRFRRDPQHLGIVGDYLYGGLSLIHALGTTDGKGQVVEWHITERKGFTPVRAFALPGVV